MYVLPLCTRNDGRTEGRRDGRELQITVDGNSSTIEEKDGKTGTCFLRFHRSLIGIEHRVTLVTT